MSRYLNAILGVVLLLGLGWSHWQAYDAGKGAIQAKFDEYKGNINDQVEKAKADAAKTKLEQEAKFDKAKLDYAAIIRDLDTALERLRKPKAVLRYEILHMAGCSSDPMSAETTDTARTAPAVEATSGPCEGSEFWANAMKDIMQCSMLIEFVK